MRKKQKKSRKNVEGIDSVSLVFRSVLLQPRCWCFRGPPTQSAPAAFFFLHEILTLRNLSLVEVSLTDMRRFVGSTWREAGEQLVATGQVFKFVEAGAERFSLECHLEETEGSRQHLAVPHEMPIREERETFFFLREKTNKSCSSQEYLTEARRAIATKDRAVICGEICEEQGAAMVFFTAPRRKLQQLLPPLNNDHDDDTAASQVVKSILSFNVWVQGGTSLFTVMKILQQQACDVIALQEISPSNVRSMAFLMDLFCDPELALLSPFPIQRTQHHGWARIANLLVANVHLKAYPYPPYQYSVDEAIQAEKTTQLASLLSMKLFDGRTADERGCPRIVLGDFNSCSHLDQESQNESHVCRGVKNKSGKGKDAFVTSRFMLQQGFKDAYWETLNRNGERTTWTPRPEEEKLGLHDRIDFVYLQGSVQVASISHIADDLEDESWPSDHRAVRVDLIT